VVFDSTVSLGNLLTIVATAIAVWGGYVRIRERLAILETKVDALWPTRPRSGPS
jgi:hypothetical protein